ncbi:capsule assembly Wzi family protein [Aquirufa sp. OSTEICH-129A]
MLLSLLLSSFIGFSSTPAIKDTLNHTSVDFLAVGSSDSMNPFWTRSLQYGTVPVENPTGIIRARTGKWYHPKKDVDWTFRVETTGWLGKESKFLLSEAYVGLKKGAFEIWAGSKREVIGLGDTTLTGGFFIWSGNALPMPKVHIGTRNYVNLLQDWLGVNFQLAHGWFDNQGAIANSYLHQKSLYLRLGQPQSTLNVYLGYNHQAQWGGSRKDPKGSIYDVYPSDFNTFTKVLLGTGEGILPDDDENNKYGNHLGSLDVGLRYQNDFVEILLYRQNPYESDRIWSLNTIDDGLTGLSFKFKEAKIIEGLSLEYLYTGNQGTYQSILGKLWNKQDQDYPNMVNYFNVRGRDGWIFQGRGLGTPFIIMDQESQQGGGLSFSYNALRSIYVGIRGTLAQQIHWMARLSSTSYDYPVIPANSPNSYLKQISASLSLQKQVNKRVGISIQLATDQGDRTKNTFGGTLGLKYSFR